MHVAFEPIHYSYHLGEWAGDAAVGALISGTLSFARPYSVGTELRFACHFGNVLLASKIKLTPQLIYHPTHFSFFFFCSRPYLLRFCFALISLWGLARNCTVSRLRHGISLKWRWQKGTSWNETFGLWSSFLGTSLLNVILMSRGRAAPGFSTTS